MPGKVIFNVLMKIYEGEEKYWFSISSEKRLFSGEIILSFSIGLQMVEREKNTMYSLRKDDLEIQGSPDLLERATEYYKMLFGHRKGNKIKMDQNVWLDSEKLLAEDNKVLQEPFTKQEMQAP